MPLEVVAGRVRGGIVRVGDSPNLRMRPHCSWVLTVGGEVIVRRGRAEATLRAGQAFLCRYPDPDHTHYVPASCPYWQNFFFDWTGADTEVDELRARSPLGVEWSTTSGTVRRLRELLARPAGLVEMAPERGAVLVRELLAEFFRAGAVPEREVPASERLVQNALRLIHSRAQFGMNVNGLARALGVSPEHLARVFRKSRGQAPSLYLREERLQAACLLLESGDLACAEIAERLGFSTPGNFTRSFRAVYGLSPGRFRANCRHRQPIGDTST
ncbi:MAG: helix-turn-helix transcriptional regulator [Lentisphaerae bacterium]|nr:helix-turn-helix transcriptional regulator [Lentisphaerota bacterium]MBT4814285.1 helix-turn-helix transcriptional regulator [Lentisphaerota bacterium]MBT5612319.1 helix-turn-helix transcriptional regulator [Lentisphaerota bacterium]MBT7056623.1 helix-turn-helix transcriptional regulator [Lentisphaerota bacterium]MBT7840548.1 helix-turn-helix transcriptional regulator [Lentisphaerota bacterium]